MVHATLNLAYFKEHVYYILLTYEIISLFQNCYDQRLLESTWTWVKGMTTTISCAVVVSVSASCGRHDILT